GPVPKGTVLSLARRAVLALAGLVAGAAIVRLALGIDLIAVLRSTVAAHYHDPSRGRPYGYWVFADIPAFLLMAGIPQTALFARAVRGAWDRRQPGLEAVLLGTLVIAAISGVFAGEVDHIWLFFVPLLVA